MRKLIATDLDGTILFNRQVSPEDLAAMERWRRAGHLLVMDTGKSVFATRDALGPCGVSFDYAVAFTGAVLTDGDYRLLSARYLPDGVVQEIVSHLTDISGITVFATTLETDYVLLNTLGDVSSILRVFSPLALTEVADHRFIGVPVRVPDDAENDRVAQVITECCGSGIELYRNQDFLDVVPAGCSKGQGLTDLLAGPLTGQEVETWSVGDSWNDLSMHAVADHGIALPWSPPQVVAACERVVPSVAALIDSVLEEG